MGFAMSVSMGYLRLQLTSSVCLAGLAMSSPLYAQAGEAQGTSGSTNPANIVVTSERPVMPHAGNIRGFAGPLAGTAGNIRGFAGNIRGFEGSAEAMAGNIRGFAGNIRGFAGNIRGFEAQVYPSTGANPAFWGTLVPASGTLAPSAGNIRGFAGDFEALAGNIRGFAGNIRGFAGNIRGFSEDPKLYADWLASINEMVKASEQSWGGAVQQRNGASFSESFTAPMLQKWGINLADPSSIQLDEATTELFLLDWYDNLMNYSGVDMVDHWMKTVNWSPALTQQLSYGKPARIGILDFSVNGAEAGNVVEAQGISHADNGHGTAVASLIVGAHNNRGVMGIAPTAEVVAYNPFDETLTAGWADIKTGLRLFADRGVSVVNMSLGVPGWTLDAGWNDVFTEDKLYKAAQKQLFVLAAGNDGVVQPKSIEWRTDKNPIIIVVGSLDPNGKISSFSNTPGETCLLNDGECEGNSDKLKFRFITAPGEFMLVSDSHGGVTRMSGTSFAAPLVSGTATLIADRWPWLNDKPEDIARIILSSAKDLGEAGVDGVYGWGQLDVAASLSPKDFSLLFWRVSSGGTVRTYSSRQMALTAQGSRATWEAAGAYVTVFESTYSSSRDFIVPLSSKLIGQKVPGSGDEFQSYLSDRFWAWAGSMSSVKKGILAYSDTGATAAAGRLGGLAVTMSLRPRTVRLGVATSLPTFDQAFFLTNGSESLRLAMGSGESAAILNSHTGMGLRSDSDIFTGGANPYLGLASGKNFASIDVALAKGLRVRTAIVDRADPRDRDNLAAGRLNGYQARATSMMVSYQPAEWIGGSVEYTSLSEPEGLLGMRSVDPADFQGGSQTDALTVGMTLSSGQDLALAATATMGHTRQNEGSDRNLAVSSGGLRSSSWQVSLTKAGLVGQSDSLRISLAQPMHVDQGSLAFTSIAVVNRLTGEQGEVTQMINLSGPRQHVAEGIYRLPILSGAAQLGVFGRMRLGATNSANPASSVSVGTSLNIRM
jgi:hypothetical protein